MGVKKPHPPHIFIELNSTHKKEKSAVPREIFNFFVCLVFFFFFFAFFLLLWCKLFYFFFLLLFFFCILNSNWLIRLSVP